MKKISVFTIFILIQLSSAFNFVWERCSCDIKDHLFICSEKKQISNNVCLNDLNLKVKLYGKINLNLLTSDLLNKAISLDLSNNQHSMEEYFPVINTFFKLRDLNLSHNQISIIRSNQFDQLSELTSLDLTFNEIFYFELNSFKELNSLIKLNLTRNKLTEIENEDFDNMRELKSISLDFNKLKRIRNGLFTSLVSIEIISLQESLFGK